MRKLVLLGVVASVWGCAQEPGSELPADLLAGDEPFVAVRKPASEEVIGQAKQALGSGSVSASTDADSFYLAIRKSELDRRWFLSAYLKQIYPGGPSFAAAETLGTRVVSFKVQNGKLFVLHLGVEVPVLLREERPSSMGSTGRTTTSSSTRRAAPPIPARRSTFSATSARSPIRAASSTSTRCAGTCTRG